MCWIFILLTFRLICVMYCISIIYIYKYATPRFRLPTSSGQRDSDISPAADMWGIQILCNLCSCLQHCKLIFISSFTFTFVSPCNITPYLIYVVLMLFFWAFQMNKYIIAHIHFHWPLKTRILKFVFLHMSVVLCGFLSS